MDWNKTSSTKKGSIIGLILFVISVAYFGIIRIILNLGKGECGYNGMPSFHGTGFCTYNSILPYLFYSIIIFGIPLFLVSLFIGWIIQKGKK
ncbi:MAG: hypothetical protein Q7S27_03205 [Nanoarchaeota archaeon]|nr:hypothetical protein [Nanoarchaeota archaeon]